MNKKDKEKIIKLLTKNKNKNRMAKTFIPNGLIKTQVIEFYKSIIKQKFDVEFDKQFYLRLHGVMEFYRYQICKINKVDYIEFCQHFRYQIKNMQINWSIMTPLWMFCFIGYKKIETDFIQQILQYVHKKIDGKQNFYIGEIEQ